MDSKRRRELIGRSHGLKAEVTIGADEVSDRTVDHVRGFLSRRELAKVRIRTDDRTLCDRVALELAERVPCEIVTRIGRVVILYQPRTEGSDT